MRCAKSDASRRRPRSGSFRTAPDGQDTGPQGSVQADGRRAEELAGGAGKPDLGRNPADRRVSSTTPRLACGNRSAPYLRDPDTIRPAGSGPPGRRAWPSKTTARKSWPAA